MYSKRLRVSLIFLIFFLIFTGAKGKKNNNNKKAKPSLFEKIKTEYLIYKNSKNELKDSILKGYILKFDKLANSKREDEIIGSKYFKADIYEKLYEITGDKDYLSSAISLYKEVSIQKNTNLSLAARKKLELLDSQPKEDNLSPSSSTNFLLTDIKHWSDSNYTRVVLEFEKQVFYEHRILKEDIENKKPTRLVIDIKNASTEKNNLKSPILVKDNLLEQIRTGQFKEDTLRVVLDLKSVGSYNIFSLTDPYRIVIDIYGSQRGDLFKNDTIEDKKIQEKKIETKHILHNIKTIVIDTGHGDHDPGAIGVDGLKEKDVTLDIGMRVGKLIKEYFPDINIIYTRQTDVFLPLEERAAIANSEKADLFISIHANASKNKSASGIETYFLNFAKEKSAMEVVARENAITLEGVDEVQAILKDLLLSSKYNESSLFASIVQKNLVSRLRLEYDNINDLGVKQGPFYVLLGSAMPSILVETSFITHPIEGKRLASPSYREKIAEGIVEGIKEYIQRTAVVQNKYESTSNR